jgi:dTDP-4-dehydrorhamnose reductase
MQDLELWGGPECTVNRANGLYRDQMRESGHHDRLGDLDRFAELGLRALRYPVLWERVAPNDPAERDWTWADERLSRLRELHVRPIVGLIHHGSGPRYTDLLADNFAPGLADHAGAVARRYPWIDEYTPVNEPVTTARFSALYGHWYPHLRDERSFWLALLNQIGGTRLAMRAIRAVNPGARLLQTDDLGRTYATAVVRDQAAFDNVRRWMSRDLLSGRVVPGHALWKRLCAYGLERRLRGIAEAPCPPDTIGVNHYLTSDRFLDHRVQQYPQRARGGSARQPYADTEAVRVLQPPPAGLEGVLREAWARYGVPLAVTEMHNGCTREEQMRWMAQGWETALRLRRDGIQVRALTAWSLVGSYGWDTLLTERGRYEPGIYEVADGKIRPTALVDLLKRLAAGTELPSPTTGKGWWQREMRFHHRPIPRPAPLRDLGGGPDVEHLKVILLVGLEAVAKTTVVQCCLQRGLAYRDADVEKVATEDREVWAVISSSRAAEDGGAQWRRLGIPIMSCDPALTRVQIDKLLDRLIDRAGNIDDAVAAA